LCYSSISGLFLAVLRNFRAICYQFAFTFGSFSLSRLGLLGAFALFLSYVGLFALLCNFAVFYA